MLKRKVLKLRGQRSKLDIKDLAKKLKGKKDFHVSLRDTWFSKAMDELEKNK